MPVTNKSTKLSSLSFLLILTLLLLLCAKFVNAVDTFEMTEKAHEMQKAYFGQWEKLLSDKEIVLTDPSKKEAIEGVDFVTIGGKKRPIYQFVGENVKKMRLKDAFYMLQNWILIKRKIAESNPDEKLGTQSVFELPIGGETYRFRLSLGFTKNQIAFYNSDGVDPTYSTIFNRLDKSGKIKDIVEAMLKSADEPLNAQPLWTVGDETTRARMRELMLITQVAEAARPTDESFEKFKNAMAAVTSLEAETEKTIWKDKMSKLLTTHTKDSLKLSEDDYNALKKKLLEGNDEVRKVTRELTTRYGTHTTAEKFLATLSLPADPTDPEQLKVWKAFKEELLKAAKSTISETNQVAEIEWKEKLKYKGKTGRIPGSDEIIRTIFAEISRGTFSTFEDAFKKVFKISLKTEQGRLDHYDLGNKLLFTTGRKRPSTATKPSDSGASAKPSTGDDDSSPEKKARLGAKDTAVGDGDSSAMKDPIASTSGASCDRRTKRDGSCTLKRTKYVEDSLQWQGKTLSFETIDEDGRKVSHTAQVDLEKMAAPKFVEERMVNIKEFTSHSGIVEGAGKTQGVYGAAVGVLASVQYFSQDQYGKGVFSAIQATHGIGGLTGVNDVIDKVTKQAIRKTIVIAAEKIGLERTLEKMSELGAKALGESASKVIGRLAGDLPFVGLAFDAYFISEDIKDLADGSSSTPEGLKITHLVLDVDTTVLSIVETAQPELTPILEPIIIALTFVRMSIDDFYYDIKDELSKVKGEGVGAQIGAFLKGFAEGVTDFFTLGLYSQMSKLSQQQEQDKQLLKQFSNPADYFNASFHRENGHMVGTIDFTSGSVSQYGGFMIVKLNDDGSVTVNLPEVIDNDAGKSRSLVKTYSFKSPVDDVILGVGEVASPEFIKKEAKLWYFIPIKSYTVISNFSEHGSSLYGVYTGNSHDNNFYTVQSAKGQRKLLQYRKKLRARRATSQADESCTFSNDFLSRYHYDLYGEDGDDQFFLGPQTAHVIGGNDKDLYFLSANGGRTIIDNFALDEEIDLLFMNVSYERIHCRRENWDLLIQHCWGAYHAVQIKNWFSHGTEKFHRHIHISTQDGVVIEVTKSGLDNDKYQVTCNAVSLDKTGSTSAENLTLTGSLSEVKQVTGSNYSDVITANGKPNILNGGLGDDTITGGNGSDIYLIHKNGGSDTINNYAKDQQEDTILFEAIYTDILVQRSGSDLTLFTSDTHSHLTTEATLESWFDGPEWQHAVFLSSDSIRFVVKGDDNGIPGKYPLTIDLSKHQHGVRLDLQNPSQNQDVHVDAELADEVKVVVDSPHDDTLIGNGLGNVFSCSGGNDFLQGNGGKDTYVINENCSSVTIQNDDQKGDSDMMLLSCPSTNVHLSKSVSPNPDSDLILTCDLSNGHHFSVHLKEWFLSAEHRHLTVKTSDKIAALIPENSTELESNHGRLFPYQIELDGHCGGEMVTFDLSGDVKYSKCERFIAKGSNCSYAVMGNDLNNYIDLSQVNSQIEEHYSFLVGGEGSDTYVVGYNDGLPKGISNFAPDKKTDYLKLDVAFHDIEVGKGDTYDAVLTSRSRNGSVIVQLAWYYSSDVHQHLLIHSSDGVMFKLVETFPYIEVLMVDFSVSTFSQVISAQANSSFCAAHVLIGSKSAENYIEGGEKTTRIIGGDKNDTIIGGPGDEDLIGFNGHDTIHGGEGFDALYGGDGDDFLDGGPDDDEIYGGMGADTIRGGPGSNTVVFSGYKFTGVSINLQIGLGWDADAEGDSYEQISNILSSEYDDFLIGNDDDNVIRSYAGDDYIVPAGGNDILQGGIGNDVYELDDAFGHKLINNFATDEELDLILLNKTSKDAICYYFYGEDLEININFDDANSTNAVARVSMDEDFLMIILPFWLRNSTYRHISFLFSDGNSTEDGFNDAQKQMEALINLVHSEQLFYGTGLSGNNITLHFNQSSWKNVYDSQSVSLQYVHFEYNSTTYYPVNAQRPPEITTINSLHLDAGSTYRFTLILSSCGLTLAISPLRSATMPPNEPINLVANPYFDGFTLSWNSPNSRTDPFVNEYEYIIRIWSDEEPGESFHEITNDTTFSIFDLIPETEYHISVSSSIHDANSIPVQISESTAKHACTNLLNLPSQMYVEDLTRNDQEQIVGIVKCSTGYKLNSDSHSTNRVICNDTSSPRPNCIKETCTIPVLTNARISVGGNVATHGDTFKWQCVPGYEVYTNGTNIITSVCNDGSWQPDITSLQVCRQKPKCPNPSVPQNGHISLSASHPVGQDGTFYVDDQITFSCSGPGYTLQGPTVKSCHRSEHDGSVANWSPSVETRCEPQICPDLPPHTHGTYSVTKSQYVTGDVVHLMCNDDYFLEGMDTQHLHGPLEIVCNGLDWNPRDKHCQPMIVSLHPIAERLTHRYFRIEFAYTHDHGFLAINDEEKLVQIVCPQVLSSYTSGNSLLLISLIQCFRQISLANGPSKYEGFIKISTQNGYAYVCITQPVLLSDVCSYVGLGQYTPSLIHNAVGVHSSYDISFAFVVKELSPHERQCTDMISCRKRCDPLHLLNGQECSHTFEGETCRFSCNPGFLLIGPSSVTCTNRGWSSTSHPVCDGEAWKEDIKRFTRECDHCPHEVLSRRIFDQLVQRYPGVEWYVIVYRDVWTSQSHYITYHSDSTFTYFHQSGHDIVVTRKLPSDYSVAPVSNLNGRLISAYSVVHPHSIDPFHFSSIPEMLAPIAQDTVTNTWHNLQDLDPIMLHMISYIILDDVRQAVNTNFRPGSMAKIETVSPNSARHAFGSVITLLV